MAWVTGETVSESFYTGITGETFTRTASYIANSAVVWNPTFTEIGSGWYRYSYATTSASTTGAYEWVGSGSGGSPVTIGFELEATGVTVTVSAATTGALTQTLQELRRRVADRLGDYDTLLSTANGDAGKTTIIDTLNINAGTEDMRGRIVVGTNGTNNGLARRVTAMTDSTGTITVSPAFTAQTLTSDTFDVFNKRGKGFTPDQYKRAINNAINDAFPLGLIEQRAQIATAYDYEAPEITVPAAFTHVHTVEWKDDEGYWNAIPRSTSYGQYGWIADAAAGQIRILGAPGYTIDGLTVRLTGYGRQATLSAESDTCALNAEYIVARACYHLATGHLDRAQEKYGPLASVFLQESQRLRSRIRTLLRPGTVMVRAA